jgi:hypothetical protein
MMNLFSKIFNAFKKKEPKLTKSQIRDLLSEVRKARQADVADYDGMGNYGRFPPIIGDDYPTYEDIIKEYESQNSK